MAGIARCPDCGAELVGSLPTEEPAAESDFAEAELCVVADELHAALLQNLLAAQGIPCRLQNASPFGGRSSIPGLRPAFGLAASTRILVNRSDLARARVVYEDFERRGEASAEDQEAPE
jgi:hypothetical protein